MKRGDLVTVSLPGNYGKPRPALVVQSDHFNETHASVSVIPVTSTIVDAPLFRITLEPAPLNGLRAVSQLMVDKVTAVPSERVGAPIGEVGGDVLVRVNRALALWLGLAA